MGRVSECLYKHKSVVLYFPANSFAGALNQPLLLQPNRNRNHLFAQEKWLCILDYGSDDASSFLDGCALPATLSAVGEEAAHVGRRGLCE
jgi:hypothetical protein